MSVPSYTRTTYNNRAAPAAGPTNLNKNEAQLKAISDEFTAELIRPATTKATIVDTDEVGGNNSANSFKWVKWTWTVIKAFLKTYFDTLYTPVGYGIGTATPPDISGTDTNIYFKGGNYVNLSGTGSNLPFGGNGFTLIVMPWSSASCNQIAMVMNPTTPQIKMRSGYNGTWGAWVSF